MPETTAAGRQNAFLDKARKFYRDGQFKAALASFKEALLSCPCTRDVMVQSKKMGLSLKEIQISRCHCKGFESLPILNSPKLAMYTLAKGPCTCGSDVFHCNVLGHLHALDGLIATLEKLEAPVKARQYATLLVITSPRAPEGYLRLAKALRLCDTQQLPETTVRCRWIYRQAIQSVQTYGDKEHPKLKIMADLLRMDILGSVPAELQTMILGNLGNRDLCRSMRVSKTWNRVCLDPNLWRHLKFVGSSRRTLRNGVINKIISKRAQCKVKSLTLWDMNRLRIDLPIFKATLKSLKQLESLSLRGSSRVEDWEYVIRQAPPLAAWSRILFEEASPCLKSLEIAAFSIIGPPATSSAPEIPMAQSLEELRLGHVTADSMPMRLLRSTVWPKLTKLSITSICRLEPFRLDLQPLARATPSLKDLCVQDLSIVNIPVSTVQSFCASSWQNLQRLELNLESVPTGPGPLPCLRPAIRSLEFPSRAIQVLSAYEEMTSQISQIGHDNSKFPKTAGLDRLEHLCLRDADIQFIAAEVHFSNVSRSLSWFMELIEPSMSNGCLKSLAITFCPETQVHLDKILNKAAISTLSCFDFRDEASGSGCGDGFATWVKGFTNLTTVGIFPQKSEACWMHVSKVLAQEARIETIYTDVLKGQPRDWILEKAREKGVKIIEASRIPEPVLQPLEPAASGDGREY